MGTFDATFGGHPFTLRLNTGIASQNIAGNFTTMNWNIQIIKTTNNTPFRNDGAPTWSLNYYGSGNFGPYSFNGAVGQTITIASGQFNVGHDANGNATPSYSWAANAMSTITTASGSASEALPRIPKPPTAPGIGSFTQASPTSAALSWSAPSNNNGGAVTGYRIQYSQNSDFSAGSTIDPGNVTSYTLTGLQPGAQYFARVAAINAAGLGAYSSSANVVLVASVGDLDGWSILGTLPSGMTPLVGTGIRRGSVYSVSSNPTGLLREIQQSTAGSVDATQQGIKRTVTTKVGTTYTLTASIAAVQTATQNTYRFGVQGIGTGSSVTLASVGTEYALPAYTFVATATSHVITIAGAGTVTSGTSGYFDAFGVYFLKLTEIPNTSPQRLQDVGMQSSLATHFSVASDTVGGAWWVDRAGVTQFKQNVDQGAIKATFSDQPGAGLLSYTDISASYQTKNVVNSIKVTNHGYDPLTTNTKDATYELSDSASVALYGVRSGSLDTEMRAGYVDAINNHPNGTGNPSLSGWIGGGSGGTISYGSGTIPGYYPSGEPNIKQIITLTPANGSTAGIFNQGGEQNTANKVVFTAGQLTTVSLWVKTNVAAPLSLRVEQANSAGTNIGTNPTFGPTVTTVANTWTKLVLTFTPQANTTQGGLYVYRTSGTWVTGNTQSVTGVMVYPGAYDPNLVWFDGASLDATGDYVYAWASGTPYSGQSSRMNYKVLNDRIKEVIADNSTPERTISSITFNAQADPVFASTVDIQDRIRVVFRGQTQDSRIIGIDHKMSGDRWEMVLALAPS